MNIDLTNKVVVITGSSKGIGKSLAQAFSKENAKVVINYHKDEEKAYQLFEEISTYNSNCMIIKANVSDPQDVSFMYRQVLKKYNTVDILINNAGICDDNLIQLMPVEQWQKIIDVNLTGTFLCCRELSKVMIKNKKGKIINIASLKGQVGSTGQTNYAASKAGMIALTKTLAKELGQFNIAVNAVCPGFIVTDLNRHNFEKKITAKNKSLLPIEFSLDDLINFILFISSDKLLGISGRVFNLDSRLL